MVLECECGVTKRGEAVRREKRKNKKHVGKGDTKKKDGSGTEKSSLNTLKQHFLF